MEVLYNITLALVNVLGKIQLKNFPISTFAVAENKNKKKPMTKPQKPCCVFCLIIKVAKQGKRSPQKPVQHRFKRQINSPKRIFLQRETDFFYFSGKKP